MGILKSKHIRAILKRDYMRKWRRCPKVCNRIILPPWLGKSVFNNIMFYDDALIEKMMNAGIKKPIRIGCFKEFLSMFGKDKK